MQPTPLADAARPCHRRRRQVRTIAAAGGLLLACGLAWAQGVVGRRGPAIPGGQPLWISDSALDDGRRLLLIVDSATRHAAVYHIDPASGSLTLRSTRDLSWDLVFEDFNAQEPKPAALRRMLETGGGVPGSPPTAR